MEQGKLGTLKEMTEESFLNRPEQAPDAIDEYLKNISPEDSKRLFKKLENPDYLETFKKAITNTSLIVFIAAFKATQESVSVDFNKYCREFLLYSKDDDNDIYKMRTFYLGNLNAEEMGIGESAEEQSFDSEEEEKLYAQEVLKARNTYDELITELLDKYTAIKIHLK